MMRELEDQTANTSTTETLILSALSTLTHSQLSHLTHAVSVHLHHRGHRLLTLLSSPILFSDTLHHLQSLSLAHKCLLISRHLLFLLRQVTSFFTVTPPPPRLYRLRLLDYDSVLILIFLCELHQNDPDALEAPQAKWQDLLGAYFLKTMLSVSEIKVHDGSVLFKYVEMVARSLRFVGQVGGSCGGCAEEVAASLAAVVALPSVEVKGSMVGSECVICREEMREGRDVCEMPCQHLFHWMCILPWLRKKNTCPCCRFQLPSDDVFEEIQRMWVVLMEIGGRRSDGGDLIMNV